MAVAGCGEAAVCVVEGLEPEAGADDWVL